MSNAPSLADSPNRALRSQFITTGQRQERRQELRFGMHKKITCIPFDDFIARFVPDALTSRCSPDSDGDHSKHGPSTERDPGRPEAPSSNPFQDMPQASVEKDMYRNITEALSGAGLTTEFEFVSTPYKGDSSERSGQAVDCGMYPKEGVDYLGPADDEGHRRMNWTWIDIAIECKMNSTDDDPFDEARDMHEPVAVGRREVLGQVLDYARLIFLYQQRTFQFMVLFLGDMARIIRIDHSGIFVTKKFKYRDEAAGLKLAHFFWNHALLSASDRGHDTTATRLDPRGPDAERMRDQVKNLDPNDYVREMLAGTLNEKWPWWKLEVPDDERGGSCAFLVGKPHFAAPGVAGRSTRGYIALDADNPDRPPVFLKDAWRVVSDDIEKEGSILKSLHEHKVRCTPTPVCHGDLAGQETRTQAVWPEYHPGKECPLKTHQHYRLVVKEVGRPLEQFQSSFQLVSALWCCVNAHAQAYSRANIIHRDISTGNMLLYRNSRGTWQGMLTDWELSKRRDQQDKKERQPDRTGTWQFLSANALNDHKKSILIEDELESFFHVLIHISVRFLPHNLGDAHVPQFLHDYFDDYSASGTDHHCGMAKLAAMQVGFINILQYTGKHEGPDRLKFLYPTPTAPAPPSTASSSAGETHKIVIGHPLNDIIVTWLSWLSAYYTLGGAQREALAGETKDIHSTISRNLTLEFQLMKADIDAGDEDDEGTSPVVPVEVTPIHVVTGAAKVDHAALTERASKLASHTALLELLEAALTKDTWPPPPDRVAERKPAKGWVPKTNDQVPKASFISGSRKRTLESVPEDLPSPFIKRSKA
ncbi:hypothetical protein C8Q79DRAFT_912191 [Trametes meyenii]|nr:hypothetical protein C8Q79DRAFT_912191 [Trametes meyenii]